MISSGNNEVRFITIFKSILDGTPEITHLLSMLRAMYTFNQSKVFLVQSYLSQYVIMMCQTEGFYLLTKIT